MRRTQPTRLSRHALALAIALTLPALASAQDAAPADATTDATTLDTITVTATRRAENAQQVPIAVSAVDGEKLDAIRSGGDDVRFLAARSPSLNVESSFGRVFPRFYLRGLGNTDFDLNASQPVSLVYDDVVLENVTLKGFPVFDVDRIEVLRGPQGTLFGRNTPAGLVKFDSVRPDFETSGYGRLSYGEYDTMNAEAAIGGGLTDTLAGRASALYQRRGDWVDNTFAGTRRNNAVEGYEDMAFRGQVLLQASEDFEALLSVQMRDLEGTARLFRANILGADGRLVPGFDPEKVAIDALNQQDLDTDGASLRMSWNLGSATLFSITSLNHGELASRGDIDGGFGAVFLPSGGGPGLIPFPAESGDAAEVKQATQELRLASNGDNAIDWQAGLYWFKDQADIESISYDTLGGGTINALATQRQDNTAWAVFGSVDWAVSETFVLRAGLRYTEDEKDFTARRVFGAFGAPAIAPITVKPSDENVSWDLAGTWTVADDVNLYARVAKGFRAPSIQGRLAFANAALPANQLVTVADSEEVLSYEVGMKVALFDNRARLNLAAFNATVDNQQLTAVGGTANFNSLLNADESSLRGFEADLEAYLTDQLLVTFGTGYNRTEIKDANLTTAICGNPLGCLVTDPTVVVGGVTLARIDGNPLPQAPEWTTNLTARYGIPLSDDSELYVYTDWAYRSEVNFFLYESTVFTGAPLLTGGVRMGYSWGLGQYEVAAFGRNILNEIEAVGGIDFNNRTGFINEPRTWGVEFKASF
ncbi:TonB-dependent receptor [Silanimonas sp.]|jgi:iron complex outermembrane receptor protein|uniref:TonB-dependent receptor n=1 Tax=Silanimonas sp. TaxID=1929290 RepID=UPI0022C5D9DF|nr:TonB-dependent receptor [Silanimonas sp.]MCZ8115061.1 TonB-dependent receptor [Silanimonas sp.]